MTPLQKWNLFCLSLRQDWRLSDFFGEVFFVTVMAITAAVAKGFVGFVAFIAMTAIMIHLGNKLINWLETKVEKPAVTNDLDPNPTLNRETGRQP